MKPVSFLRILCVAGLVACSAGYASAQDGEYQPAPSMAVNYENRLSAVEDQLRALTGKIEQLDYALRRIDNSVQRLQSDSDTRLSRLEAAAVAPPMAQTSQPQAAYEGSPAAPDKTPSPTPAADHGGTAIEQSSVRGTLGAIKVQGDAVTGAVNSPKAPALPPTPPNYGLTPREQYDKAFALLRQADYEGAEKTFKTFIDANPKDKMIDNAKYWYAETFYVRNRFNDAAMAFADAYQQNAKGTKAPDSLLKLALSLSSLEKKDDACTTLAALKKEYPAAPVTIRARADQERARLKCGRSG